MLCISYDKLIFSYAYASSNVYFHVVFQRTFLIRQLEKFCFLKLFLKLLKVSISENTCRIIKDLRIYRNI